MTEGRPAGRPIERWPRPVVGAVLCGGRSSRFGSDKALAPFRGSTVGQRVVDALRGAGIDPVVAVGGQAGDALGRPTGAPPRPGEGPLAGLATALTWARRGWVLVVPCDLPLLTADHVERLLAAGPERGTPIVATVDGRPQVSLALWPADRGPTVRRLLDDGVRRYRAALDGPGEGSGHRPPSGGGGGEGWRGVEVAAAAVADADTPEALAELEAGGI